jgi:hypothetical protein
MIKQFAKLASLVLACGICFYLGMLADAEKNKLESRAVIHYFKGELDSIESQVAELEAREKTVRQEIARDIILRFKLSCDTANGFMLGEKLYVCIPGDAPQTDPQNDMPNPYQKNPEYVL